MFIQKVIMSMQLENKQKKTDQGLVEDVVVNILKVVKINKMRNYVLYSDNFFRLHSLLSDVYHMEFLATGTIRHNRVVNCPLPSM